MNPSRTRAASIWRSKTPYLLSSTPINNRTKTSTTTSYASPAASAKTAGLPVLVRVELATPVQAAERAQPRPAQETAVKYQPGTREMAARALPQAHPPVVATRPESPRASEVAREESAIPAEAATRATTTEAAAAALQAPPPHRPPP